MNYVKLSVRSLLLRWRQYISLFFVCAIGAGVSLFSFFLINGMLHSLSTKAEIYYGGNYQFLGGRSNLEFYDCREFVEKLSDVFPAETVISPRFDFDADSASFYYEGVEVRQRVIKGVDFEKEKILFSKFNYVQGSADGIAGTNGVLVSEKIASMLEVSTGDSITFMLRTGPGYINTVQIVVKGIFKDSSVFGTYTSYIDIDFLRKAYCSPEFYANRIGIFFPDSLPSSKDTLKYQSLLEKKFNMYKLVNDKYDFYEPLLAGEFSEPIYAFIVLDANMEDLGVIIDAMKIITSLVIAALVIIIVVGISSTYKVIVMKRINEIGIYKAIGMERGSVILLLLSEALVLLISGCVCGWGFCLLLEFIVRQFNFSFIPAFDMFLTNGYIVPMNSFGGAMLIFAVIIFTTISAILFSLRTAIRITPVQALTVTE
ncbi:MULTISPECIES: ABC transporter permease [unclassified Treponema]|uniref:ABC transporter permease n=1 Tax=unclassified Treponema TaxID=2638727 RepID=UPI0025EBA5D6|nr:MULTISPECIES: FtsX-like permease family protein [unclassified Treponema]